MADAGLRSGGATRPGESERSRSAPVVPPTSGASACSWRARTQMGPRPSPGCALPRSWSTDSYSCSCIQVRSSASTVAKCCGPWRSSAEVIITTSAPTMRPLTTSRPGVDAGGRRQGHVGTQLRPQDRDPAHRQAHLPRLAQLEPRHDVQRVEVEVRLVEAIEQHEAVGAALDDCRGEVRERRVVRAELDGQRDRDRRPRTAAISLQVGRLHLRGRPVRVGSDVVEVQLERIGARVLHQPRVANPAAAACSRSGWRSRAPRPAALIRSSRAR